MAKGFLYLVVIMDWVSRALLAWRLSNTLGADFCVEAVEEALATIRQTRNFQHGPGLPVHQQRVHRCTRALRDHDQHGWQEPAPAKAGGRYMDNIFVARLWRSLKYEE